VTICIAGSCTWNYAPVGQPPQSGTCIIMVSDRMMTAGDVEYEPRQYKLASLTDNIQVLIAGDLSVHAQAVRETKKQIGALPSASVHNAATIYGQAIQAVRRKLAEDTYLAPLGLNTDTFLAQAREMPVHLAEKLTMQLQEYDGPDVAALVVSPEIEHSRIYVIDHRGSTHCFDDVGFAAVGSGAWHARSKLMQLGYVKFLPFVRAFGYIYAAKKAAEVAPGVGRKTDVHIVLQNSTIHLEEEFTNRVDGLFGQLDQKQSQLFDEHLHNLNEVVGSAGKETKTLASGSITGSTDHQEA
jgi:20S proteasome alpha/beta subunit